MEHKSFRDLLMESKKEYKFTVKVACDDITDEHLDKLEEKLHCYDLQSASEFKKTPLQKNPLDFPNLHNTHVFISEITVAYPATHEQIELKIAESLGLSSAQVVVYTENDPRREYTERMVELMDPDSKEEYKPVIGTFPEESENPPYGEEVIKELMDEHEDQVKDRETYTVINNLSNVQVIDKSTHAGDEKAKPDTKSLFGRTRD